MRHKKRGRKERKYSFGRTMRQNDDFKQPPVTVWELPSEWQSSQEDSTASSTQEEEQTTEDSDAC